MKKLTTFLGLLVPIQTISVFAVTGCNHTTEVTDVLLECKEKYVFSTFESASIQIINKYNTPNLTWNVSIDSSSVNSEEQITFNANNLTINVQQGAMGVVKLSATTSGGVTSNVIEVWVCDENKLGCVDNEDGRFLMLNQRDFPGYSGPLVVPPIIRDVHLQQENFIKVRGLHYLSCQGGSIRSAYIDDSITVVGDNSFESCKDLNYVKWSKNTKLVDQAVFKNCYRLETIDDIENVEKLEYGSFYTCVSLKHFVLPKAVTKIPNLCFSLCLSLEGIHVHENITEIADDAFQHCLSLSNLTVSPDNATYIEVNNNIVERATKTIVVGGCNTDIESDQINTIGKNAFSMRNIKNVVIPSNIQKIDLSAFSSCHNLESVKISKNTTNIVGDTFSGCEKLSSIEIDPSSTITTIPYEFAQGCRSLTEFAFPSNVTTIGAYAFASTGIKNLTLPNNLTTINLASFSQTPIKTITIPVGVTEIPTEMCANCQNLESVDIKNPNITSIGSSSFQNTKISSFVFSSACKSIGPSAFENTLLTDVTIPSSVTELGYGAFNKCSNLQNADLSNSKIEIVDSETFAGCSKLETVSFPNTIEEIRTGAFNGCTKITNIDLSTCTKLTRIGEKAFYSTSNLTSCKIPASVTKIGDSAFASGGITTVDLSNFEDTAKIPTIGTLPFKNADETKKIKFIVKNSSMLGAFQGTECWQQYNDTAKYQWEIKE